MKILLTGSHGYLGSVLSQRLLSDGHEVVGLDNNNSKQNIFSSEMKEMACINKDICNVNQEDLKGFDAICHLAGLPNNPRRDIDLDLFFSVNSHASIRLAELAKNVGIERFVFASSCSIYGAANDDILTEESPTNPLTPYGKSKLIVEQKVSKLADEKFSPIFLRISSAYGISPQHRFDLILNKMVAWAFASNTIEVKNDGSFWRPITHIEDISRAFVAVLEAERNLVHNEIFNVGITSENFRIKDITSEIANMIPGCKVTFSEDTSSDKRNYRVNFDKLRNRIPAFQPQWNIQKGIQELYRAYRVKKITMEDLNIYSNNFVQK